MIVFDKEENGEKFTAPDFNKDAATIIAKPWKVTLNAVNGSSKSLTLEKLIDFSTREDLKTFGGTIIYENDFQSSKSGRIKYLNLGETYGVSEIEINNQKIGIQWYGTPVYDISKFVKQGVNTIRIKFTTTLGNYMKSLKNNEVAQEWTKNQPLFQMGLIGPVRVL